MIQNLGGRIVNNWLYRYADGYVLIDTGYENGYKHFCKQLKKKGIAPQDIHYLFLTHAHDDHAGFLNELLAAIPNLTVIADEKALDVLRKGQNPFTGGCTGRLALTFCKLMALFGKGDHLFPPLKKEYENRLILISDENIHDLDKVLGGKIIRTPGHTADSMSLLLNDGTLFCGDAAMNGFPSVNNVTIWAEDMRDFACSCCLLVGENHHVKAEEDLPRPRQAVFRFRPAKEFGKAEQSQIVSFGAKELIKC